MGHEARERCAEDDLCAEALVDLLQDGRRGTVTEIYAIRCATRRRHSKFFDPACEWAPSPDFGYCTEVDRFDFVLRLRRAPDGRLELHASTVPGAQ